MNWKIKSFDQLSLTELYLILQARVQVFVVEQNCPYPEVDGIDPNCTHLFKREGDRIVAYARLIPQGVLYDEASIGRILVAESYRKMVMVENC